VFLRGPYRDLISNRQNQLLETVLHGNWAEESPLLESVARERLLKTKQAGINLAGAVVISKF
jgi:hypothetical protein